MKKIIASILALTALTSAMVGCSSGKSDVNSALPANYSELKKVDTEYFGETTYDGIKIVYNTHNWVETDLGYNTFTLFKRDEMSGDNVANITFANSDSIPSGMTINQYLSELKSSLGDLSTTGTTIYNEQIMKLDGFEVAYLENTIEITDAMLDSMIELGIFTEEMIELSGGRDVITSIEPTKQVSIGRIVGEKAYTFTGTYYNNDSKQDVIDGIVAILQNIEIN